MKKTTLKRKQPLRRATYVSKPRPPLPRQSPKRKARNAEYEAAVQQWRAGHDGRCEMRFDQAGYPISYRPVGSLRVSFLRCQRSAGPRPHHMARRGRNLCNVTTFMGVCQQCHDWIHSHTREARRLGYLITAP